METINLDGYGPFRVKLGWMHDDISGFDHYGEFCEVHGPGNYDRPYVYNAPDGKDFYVKNPHAWRMDDVGLGTESWIRRSDNRWGWFRLAEHPKHEVEYLMREQGLPEREAWVSVLRRVTELVGDLANGEITQVVIQAEVYHGDARVGFSQLWGIEGPTYLNESVITGLAHECGVIDEAMHEAEKTLTKRIDSTEQLTG